MRTSGPTGQPPREPGRGLEPKAATAQGVVRGRAGRAAGGAAGASQHTGVKKGQEGTSKGRTSRTCILSWRSR